MAIKLQELPPSAAPQALHAYSGRSKNWAPRFPSQIHGRLEEAQAGVKEAQGHVNGARRLFCLGVTIWYCLGGVVLGNWCFRDVYCRKGLRAVDLGFAAGVSSNAGTLPKAPKNRQVECGAYRDSKYFTRSIYISEAP